MLSLSPHFLYFVLKGNGSAFAAPFARAIRGDFNPTKSELMTPSVTTKECLLAAFLMLTFADKDLIYISLVVFFITIKVQKYTQIYKSSL